MTGPCPAWCTVDRPHVDHEWVVESLRGVLVDDTGHHGGAAWAQLVVHGRDGADPMPVLVVVLGRLESVRIELTWQRLLRLGVQAESAAGRLSVGR